jgi:hypothetical protein
MCSDPKCEAQAALTEVLIALDGSVNALVMARIILERYLPEPVEEPTVPEVVIIPEQAPEDDTCPHVNTFPITTGAGTVSMCHACGEVVGDHA